MAFGGFRQKRSSDYRGDRRVVTEQILEGLRIIDVDILSGEIGKLFPCGPLRRSHLRSLPGIGSARVAKTLTIRGFWP
jgi:hypothetical protein